MQPSDLERLIIFPLPNVVLLPCTELPLHIFEPRYRTMTRDAIEQERLIAMATIDPAATQERRASSTTAEASRDPRPPAVLPLVGVGRLREWKELPDGRFYMVLEGVGRARIVEEHETSAPYREVRAVEVPDELGDPASTQRSLDAVRGMMLSMRIRNPRLAALLNEELTHHPDPAAFSSRLAAMMHSDIAAQYRILETLSVPARMDDVVEQISSFLARSSSIPSGELN